MSVIRSSFLSVLAIACIAVLGLPARAASSDAWHRGLSWQFPASHLVVTAVTSDWRSDYDAATHGQGPIYFVDCAMLKNVGTEPVRHVQIVFASVGTDGVVHGSPLPVDANEQIAPGTASKSYGACRDHAFANGDGGRWLVGWVNVVDYADGTRWIAPPLAGADAQVTPSEPVAVEYPGMYFPLQECADIRNLSNRTIRHVQMRFTRGLQFEKSQFVDVLDMNTEIAPGAIARRNCRTFQAEIRFRPDYADQLVNGLDIQMPWLLIREQPVSLRVEVTRVDFTDGTSWTP